MPPAFALWCRNILVRQLIYIVRFSRLIPCNKPFDFSIASVIDEHANERTGVVECVGPDPKRPVFEGTLPGFKAIVVTLKNDLFVSHFEEHCKMRFHLGAGGKRAQRNGTNSAP
jgi:hypothetical protein